MTKAASLTLIALGAVLAFAVNGNPPFVNVQVVGWIIMATGAAGMVIPRSRYDAVRRRIVRTRYSPVRRPTGTGGRRHQPQGKQAASRARKGTRTAETVEDYYITADPADVS